MNDYLTAKQIVNMVGISYNTFMRCKDRKEIPEPDDKRGNINFWKKDNPDLVKFIDSRKKQSRAKK